MAKSTKSTKKKRTEKSSPRVASQSETVQETQFFSPVLRLLILGILFVAAFCIRAYHITEAPLEFHPGRQYHCAIRARAFYFNTSKSIPEWKKEIANINRQVTTGELPIMEFIASIAYRIAGGEHLWIPRLMSSIFWLIGGAFLYLFVKKIFSADAAVFSTAFYLFLPYGIIASRSFQPNPLMIMLLIISIMAIFQYYEQPSTRRLVTAAILSALAFFIYPTAVFFIFGAFVCLAFYRYGIWRAIINSKFWLFAVVTLLPTVIYYVYLIFIVGFLKGYAGAAFLPHILLRSFFWKGWLNQIEKVVGLAALIGALLGIFMFRKGLAKVLMIGLWTGYFAYSLIFSYHSHTHDYYQLPLVPIVALSLGAIAALITNRLSQTCTRWHWRVPALVIIFFAVFLSIYKVQPKLFNPYFKQYVEIAKEIGAAVGHSTKTIFLTYAYGKPLKYHGELCGRWWPSRGDFRSYALRGLPRLSAEERFNTIYSKDSPEYFIVTDFRAFQEQPDLKEFLAQNFPVLVNNRNYLIFDLKKSLQKDG